MATHAYQLLPLSTSNATEEPNSPDVTLEEIPYQGQASITSSVASLTNTLIGTGMLVLYAFINLSYSFISYCCFRPHAISTSGILLGALVLTICGLATGCGLILLSECAPKAGHRQSSFYALSKLAIPKYLVLVELAIAVKVRLTLPKVVN